MIDHIGVGVENYELMKAFYTAALAPLGYRVIMEAAPPEYPVRGAGFGIGDKPDLWISEEGRTQPHLHLAFAVPSREFVDAFYDAAIAAGGADNGKPGIREEYHPDYYGAFVIDPEGHNIEAVCREPEAE